MNKVRILSAAMTLILLVAAGDLLAADARVTATGKFLFADPESHQVTGIRRARVEMCDEDGFPFGCTVFATGETDDRGWFSLTGTSGDWFADLPEAEVRIYATSAAAEVSNGTSVYCFKTQRIENVPNGRSISFGYITPESGSKCTFGGSAADENGAWVAFQWSREAYDFLSGTSSRLSFSGLGQPLERQRVKWPAASSSIHADYSGFDLKRGDEAPAVKTMSLYTGAAMSRRLGLAGRDWDGGFGYTFALIIARAHGYQWDRLCSFTDPVDCGTPEDPPHVSHQIGGMSHDLASIGTYWDLFDVYPDASNHDGNASSDVVGFSLDLLWSTMLDPNPGDGIDNSPSNVTEYGQALIQRVPTAASDIRMVYDENHLPPPWGAPATFQ